MSHVYLPDKWRGRIGSCRIRIVTRNAMLYFVKYCGNGITTQCSFAIYIFISGSSIDIYNTYTGSLLPAIMLFLHQQVKAIQSPSR